MKANYKVVNNRQAQLKKVIQNFEPTGVCARSSCFATMLCN